MAELINRADIHDAICGMYCDEEFQAYCMNKGNNIGCKHWKVVEQIPAFIDECEHDDDGESLNAIRVKRLREEGLI